MSSSGNRPDNQSDNVLTGGNVDIKKWIRERRRKGDKIVSAAVITNMLAWCVAFISWLMFDMAAEYEAGWFNIWFQVEVAVNPLTETLLPISFWLLIGSLSLAAISLIFNRMRMNRKEDKYRKSVFVIAAIDIYFIYSFIYNYGTDFLW